MSSQDKQNSKEAQGKDMSPTKVEKETTGQLSSFKLLLLVLMVLQNSSAVLLGRYARTSVTKDELFNVNHLVLVTEVAKLILSSILEFQSTNGNLLKSVKENILDRPLSALKISVPALLYLIQNTLLYVALSNLTAPIFQVTYQGKLVTTAVVSVIMLNRKYNLKQWVCLVVLSLGVALVVLGEQKDDEKQEEEEADKPSQSITVGLISVTTACICSALAGVYFEKVLKKGESENGVARAPVSMWMRNMQLATFSIIIGVFQGISQGGDEEPKPYLHGFNACVWTLVALQAGGGMLVAAVIKYADNVLKGLATGVSVVVGTAFSSVFFHTVLTGQFTVGAVMILVSVYFFSNEMPKCLLGSKSVEMAPMLPR
mmetsp:Transcript_33459/g.50474  ORF Transcript_33459/g.50474 Transcript_33459/m.50474 type:complete len:372 (+) Transcript_33459:139-1254(+)